MSGMPTNEEDDDDDDCSLLFRKSTEITGPNNGCASSPPHAGISSSYNGDAATRKSPSRPFSAHGRPSSVAWYSSIDDTNNDHCHAPQQRTSRSASVPVDDERNSFSPVRNYRSNGIRLPSNGLESDGHVRSGGSSSFAAALSKSFHEILPRTRALTHDGSDVVADSTETRRSLLAATAGDLSAISSSDVTNSVSSSDMIAIATNGASCIRINENAISDSLETVLPRPKDSSASFAVRSLTNRDKLVLLCLAVVDLTSQMCLSIMAPFFPAEALNKGVSSSTSGWIFGIFALVQFATSPLCGKVLPHFGSRFLITSGQFFSGGCVLLFGFLDKIGSADDNSLFVIFCFTLRIFLAIGCTASATASFAVTASVFPDHVATVFGLLETATGLGMMVGPALGGLLYEVDGFYLPFVALGSLMIATVPLNYLCLPAQDDNRLSIQSVSLFRIIRIPAIVVVCLAVIVAALIWSILDPTLAPHIQTTSTDITPAILGLLFLLMSACYAVFSPIWGWLADRTSDSSPMLVLGFLVSGVGLLLLGPSKLLSFMTLDESTYDPLWVNIIALVVLGISVSLALVPTFDKILDAVEKAGIEDSFEMYSIVAGIWGGCYALGDFIGPALGGYLDDNTPGGFPDVMTYTALICFVMAFIVFVLWFFESRACCRMLPWLRHTVCCPTTDSVDRKRLIVDSPSSTDETTDGAQNVDIEGTPLLVHTVHRSPLVFVRHHLSWPPTTGVSPPVRNGARSANLV